MKTECPVVFMQMYRCRTPTNPDDQPNRRDERKFDLSERTAKFGELVIAFAKRIPRIVVTLPLIGQLVRAATSVGANYGEADDAISRKDFRHRIGICKNEARESKFWFRMIVAAEPCMKAGARPLWLEAHELYLIFSSIRRRTSVD